MEANYIGLDEFGEDVVFPGFLEEICVLTASTQGEFKQTREINFVDPLAEATKILHSWVVTLRNVIYKRVNSLR